MADVLNRTTGELLKSVNTPDYPESDYIINPDLSAVQDVPAKYLKIEGDAVSEMDASEKVAVDSVVKVGIQFYNEAVLSDGRTVVLDEYTLKYDSGVKDVDLDTDAVSLARTKWKKVS